MFFARGQPSLNNYRYVYPALTGVSGETEPALKEYPLVLMLVLGPAGVGATALCCCCSLWWCIMEPRKVLEPPMMLARRLLFGDRW